MQNHTKLSTCKRRGTSHLDGQVQVCQGVFVPHARGTREGSRGPKNWTVQDRLLTQDTYKRVNVDGKATWGAESELRIRWRNASRSRAKFSKCRTFMMQQLRPQYDRDKSEPHQCSTSSCNSGTLQGSSILRSMRCLVSTTVLQSTTFLVETLNLASGLARLPTYRGAFSQATKLMKLKEGKQRPRPFNGNLRGQTLGQTYRQFCRPYYHRTGTSRARLGQTDPSINIEYTTAMKSFRDAHLSSHLRSSAGRIGPRRRLCQLTSLR